MDTAFDFVHRVCKFYRISVPELRNKFTVQILELTLLIIKL